MVAGDGEQGFRPIHLQAAAEFGKLVWGCEAGVLPRDVGDVTGEQCRPAGPHRNGVCFRAGR